MSDSKELLDEANGKIALRADGWLSPEEVAALRSEVATLRERLRVIAAVGTGAALTEAWRLLEDANDEAEEDAETIRRLLARVAELEEAVAQADDETNRIAGLLRTAIVDEQTRCTDLIRSYRRAPHDLEALAVLIESRGGE